MFAAILISSLTMLSCKKQEPTPEPEPVPETVVRLSSEKSIKTSSTAMYAETTFNWENGILMQVDQSLNVPALNMNQMFQNKMVYENGNIVRIDELNGKWQYIYTYEGGLLKSLINIYDNDTIAWSEVTAYTEDGHVKEIMDDFGSSKHRYTLTWVDGDATEVIHETLEPEEIASTNVVNYTYDNNPNAYTAVPLAWAVRDGDGYVVSRFMSKHNQIHESYTYSYDENRYLTSYVKENDSTFYNYIEQTLR